MPDDQTLMAGGGAYAPTDTPAGIDPSLIAQLEATNLSPDQIRATQGDLTDATKGLKRAEQLEEQSADEKFQGTPPADPGTNLMGRMAPLMLFSAFGGAKSKAFAGAALSSTIGTVKGFLEGNDEAYAQHMAAYKQTFDEWKEHHEQQQKIYNEMREAYKGRVDADIKALQFARQVTGDQVKSQIQTMQVQERMNAAMDQLRLGYQKFYEKSEQDQINNSFKSRKLADAEKQLQGAGGKLDENGHWMVEQMAAGGDFSGLKAVQSRYGGAIGAAVMNDVGAQLKAEGMDPRDITEAHMNLAVQTSVQRVASQRLAAVDRLTGSVQTLEPRLTDLIQKVNGNGAMTVDQFFNAVKRQVGDKDLAELQTLIGTVGRQYMEAATMPGSNAQMHQGAQDKADTLFSGSTNLENWMGTLKGINEEMHATQAQLKKQVDDSRKAITGQGATMPTPKWNVKPDATPPPQPGQQPTAPPAAAPPPGGGQQQPKVIPWNSLPTS